MLVIVCSITILYEENRSYIDNLYFSPKKLLMDLFQSSKEKKEARKRPHIDHYHVHYYPVTIPIFEPLVKAPKKHKLEEIYQ